MHLHQLKYFVSVVKTGSVTRAAEHCFISQPSLSQQLTKLEDSIGRKLFSRVKGKMVLTEPGQVLYEQAVKILSSVEEARHRVSDVDNKTGGAVSIGILPTLAPFMLPGSLLALAEKYPEAMVMVREEISESIIDASARGEIDILIEVLPFDQTNLDVEKLFTDRFYVAVHRDSPLSRLQEIPLTALDGIPFILLEDIHCLARQIEKFFFKQHFMPRVLFKTSQLETVKRLIEINYGVSILPSIAIEAEPRSHLRYIPLQGNVQGRDVVIATAKDRYLSPAAEYFIATVKDTYQTSFQHDVCLRNTSSSLIPDQNG